MFSFDYSKLRLDKIFLLLICSTVIKVFFFNHYVFDRNLFQFKGQLLTVPGSLLVIYSFAYLFKNGKRSIYLVLISLGLSIYLVTNLWHFRYFHEPFSLLIALQSANLKGLGPSILDLVRVIDLVFILDTVILIVYLIRVKPVYLRRSVGAFLIIALIGTGIFVIKPMKNLALDKRSLSSIFFIYDKGEYFTAWSPLGYMARDLLVTFNGTKHIELAQEEKEFILNWFKEQQELIKYDNHKFEYLKGVGQGKNLILIQVESLENFVINKSVHNQEITPNLNKLAAKGFYFSNIYPQVKGGRSSDAELMVNTSLLPVKEGSTFFRYPSNSYITLPKLLKQDGYKAIAFHGDHRGFWNRNEAFASFGFDRYYARNDYNMDEIIGMGLSDGSFFKQSVDILEKETQPFYAQLITLSSHTPFEIPDKYRELNLSSIPEKHVYNYLHSIHYTDKVIGEFLENLKARGLLENSIIAIYSDHEALDYLKPELIATSESFRWVEEHTIPFILYIPQLKGQEIKTMGGQLDIYPTLAYLMGIDEQRFKMSIMGKNLFEINEKDGFVVYHDTYLTADGKFTVGEQRHFLERADVAELIIRSDYFSQYRQ